MAALEEETGGDLGEEESDSEISTSSSEVDYSSYSYPIHRAAADGAVDALQVMLDQNQNAVSALDDDGETPLYGACAQGEEGSVQCLLGRGANPNQATVPEGSTCLGVASANNRVPIVRLLLEAGAAARINNQDDEKNTATHLAAWNGSKESLELLLAARARTNLKNKEGKTAKSLADPSCQTCFA